MWLRLYVIVAVFDRTGKRVTLPMKPTDHHAACTMLSKFSPYAGRRLVLEEVPQ